MKSWECDHNQHAWCIEDDSSNTVCNCVCHDRCTACYVAGGDHAMWCMKKAAERNDQELRELEKRRQANKNGTQILGSL